MLNLTLHDTVVTSRGQVWLDIYEKALKEVENGTPLKQVVRSYAHTGLKRSSLQRYRKKVTALGSQSATMGYHKGVPHVLSLDMDKALAKYVVDLSAQFFGLTPRKLRILAFEFTAQNKLATPESWNSRGMAGRRWLQCFLTRNNLSMRKPEPTSLSRATAFNPITTKRFFDNLDEVLKQYQFTANDIYNADETGIRTVHSPGLVIDVKGKKQIGSLVSAEKGELVTLVCAVSATGNSIPPMYIFPRKRNSELFMKGSLPTSISCANSSGWINEDLWLEFLQHFVTNTRCSPDKRVLLIIDNHNSHTSLRAIDFARDNGLVILTIFPHTSHKLQPLDVSVFSPFKRAYSVVLDDWKACNVGKRFSIYEVAQATAKAYDVEFTHNNIKAGFRATGIWPFDRNIFTESDFLPSKPTDFPQDEDPVATSMRCRGQVMRNDEANHCYSEALSPEEWLRASETPHESLVEGQVSSPAGQNLPCTSSTSRPVEDNCVIQRRGGELEPEVDDGNAAVAVTSDTSVKHSCKAPTNQAMIASPGVVSPVPKAKRSIPKQKSKNKGDTLILTSTPVKMKLSLRKVKPLRPKRKKRHQVPDKLVVSRKI